jgi:hypothetical protein
MNKCLFANGICLAADERLSCTGSPTNCVFFLSEREVAKFFALGAEMLAVVQEETCNSQLKSHVLS